VERTTDRIAKFFIKIAEQIYPVVEIMPGRKVTMMVESGSLKRVDKNKFIHNRGMEFRGNTKSNRVKVLSWRYPLVDYC